MFLSFSHTEGKNTFNEYRHQYLNAMRFKFTSSGLPIQERAMSSNNNRKTNSDDKKLWGKMRDGWKVKMSIKCDCPSKLTTLKCAAKHLKGWQEEKKRRKTFGSRTKNASNFLPFPSFSSLSVALPYLYAFTTWNHEEQVSLSLSFTHYFSITLSRYHLFCYFDYWSWKEGGRCKRMVEMEISLGKQKGGDDDDEKVRKKHKFSEREAKRFDPIFFLTQF